MTEELSKNTLVVLVVLTVIVSLLGTWTVINEVSKVEGMPPAVAQSTSVAAGVSLEITPSAAQPPAPVQATGQVTLTIKTP